MDAYSYTYLFVLGLVMAFMDAFGIGANDVSSSFATSVGSRSITMKQACIIAIFTEFGGAVLMGSKTTETIKSGIIDTAVFADNPALLMLAFVCALMGSAFWVLLASHYGWPVSTTHSIVGAICGVGISASGFGSVKWGWNGMGRIVASWFISPVAAGCVASFIYLATKYIVLKHPNSLQRGLNAIPVYFGITFTICVLYIILKGGSALKKQPLYAFLVAAAVGLVFAILCFFFIRQWMYRKLVKEEDLRWYHAFTVPWMPPRPRDPQLRARISGDVGKQAKALAADGVDPELGLRDEDLTETGSFDDALKSGTTTPAESAEPEKVEKPISTTRAIWNKICDKLFHNMNQDIASNQARAGHLKDIHAHSVKYDSKTEYLYSFLQVVTAAFTSFAHGSNDVSNAVGPLAAIYEIWRTAAVPSGYTMVPIWILALGGIGIDMGLTFFGYRVMQNMGNNITYHSPSRGFSMELGAALTVISASYIGLPVSTTHCITGATAMVGLCSGSYKAINWRMLAWCFFSWFLTVPVAAVVSGSVFALIANAPRL